MAFDIVLIRPPFPTKNLFVYTTCGLIFPPIELAYLAAYLEENDYKVKIIDAQGEQLSVKEVCKRLEKISPPVVGLTGFTGEYHLSELIGSFVKENLSSKLIIGGTHATVFGEEIIKSKIFDVAIVKEGEQTLLELMQYFDGKRKNLKSIRNIIFRKNNFIIKTKRRKFIRDLDSLPYPAFHLLPNYKTHYGGELNCCLKKGRFKILPVIFSFSSRGCPYNCPYCEVPIKDGVIWRPRSAKNLVKEIETRIKEFKIKSFGWMDDNFCFSSKRVEEFCKELKERNLDIKWYCHAPISWTYENKKLVNKMYRAGLRIVNTAVESLRTNDETVMRFLEKENFNRIIRSFKFLKNLGIATYTQMHLGSPEDTEKIMEYTINLAMKANPTLLAMFSFLPIKGTPMYPEIIDLIETFDLRYYNGYQAVANTKYVSRDIVSKYIEKAWRNFFLREEWLECFIGGKPQQEWQFYKISSDELEKSKEKLMPLLEKTLEWGFLDKFI